jgi:hypothetical protein
MTEWLKAGLADKVSTFWGAAALGVGVVLVGTAFFAPDVYSNVKDAVLTSGELLMMGGVGGVLWRKQT